MYANRNRRRNTSRDRAAKGRRRQAPPAHTNDAQGRLTPLWVLARSAPTFEVGEPVPPVRGGAPARDVNMTPHRQADIAWSAQRERDAVHRDLYGY